jgi:hypothetical protein
MDGSQPSRTSVCHNMTRIGTGRVPHVRLSVRGPKKKGEAHHSFQSFDQQIQRGQEKQSKISFSSQVR